MIRFKRDTTLQVIESFNEKADAITEEIEETFKAGVDVDADIFDEEKDHVSIQFGNGSVAFNVPHEIIEIVKG